MTWNCLAFRAVQTFAFVFFFAHPCLCQQKISDAVSYFVAENPVSGPSAASPPTPKPQKS